MEHAVAQRRRQSQQEDADAADQAALRAVPSGEFAHTGKDVLKHRQLRGEGRENHKQEEQRTPDPSACHVVEDGRHRVKQQRGAGVDFDAVGEAGREHNEARHDRHEGVKDNHVDRLAHQGVILADVASEDRHGADADAQREERLVHRRHNHRAGDLGEVRYQIELQAFFCPGEHAAVDRQDQHQRKERHHQVLGHALQAALQVKAQHAEAEQHRDGQIGHVDPGIRDHAYEAQIRASAGEELHEVIHHPAGHNRVERHQREVSDQRQISVDMPLLTGFFQFVIHAHRARLGRSAHGELHGHRRQAEQQQAQHIDQHETAAAILTGHPRELPDVSAADRTAGAEQQEAETAAELFSFLIHHLHILSFDHYDQIGIIIPILHKKSIKSSHLFQLFRPPRVPAAPSPLFLSCASAGSPPGSAVPSRRRPVRSQSRF